MQTVCSIAAFVSRVLDLAVFSKDGLVSFQMTKSKNEPESAPCMDCYIRPDQERKREKKKGREKKREDKTREKKKGT